MMSLERYASLRLTALFPSALLRRYPVLFFPHTDFETSPPGHFPTLLPVTVFPVLVPKTIFPALAPPNRFPASLKKAFPQPFSDTASPKPSSGIIPQSRFLAPFPPTVYRLSFPKPYCVIMPPSLPVFSSGLFFLRSTSNFSEEVSIHEKMENETGNCPDFTTRLENRGHCP